MVIRIDGDWQVGENPADLADFVRAEGACGYPVHEVRHCVCASCGGDVFGVEGDLGENTVRRTCRRCGAVHFIADSAEHWHEADAGIMACECENEADDLRDAFHVAVGYSLYADAVGIRALAVSSMCVVCGKLGHWDDWMVRDGDMGLLDRA